MQKRLGWLIFSLLLVVVGSVMVFFYFTGHLQTRVNTIAEEKFTKQFKSPTGDDDSMSSAGNQPTATGQASSNFVGTAQLTEVGQYRLTADGIEQKLVKMKTLNKYMTDGDFTYHITGVALVRERARDNHALQIARRLYNDHGLSSEYYTLTLSYTVANDSANTVVTRGVTAATYKNKVAMSMLTGLVNSGLATTSGVISGGSSTAMMTALVPKEYGKKVNRVDLQFSALFDSNGLQVTKPTRTMTVTF